MTPPRQPLLHDALTVLRAPTQVWSAPSGAMGAAPIHGVYLADVRIVRGLELSVGGAVPEHIATGAPSASEACIQFLLRDLDDPTPDPGVRLDITRTVDANGMTETLRLSSRQPHELTTRIRVALTADASLMESIKQGRPEHAAVAPVVTNGVATWSGESVDVCLSSDGFALAAADGSITLTADITVPARGETTLSWRLDASDRIAAVRGADGPAPWSTPDIAAGDARLARWVAQSLTDLDALRMTTTSRPDQQFLAAGAPWFFTLFGRDSLWAARFLLPLGTGLAADTLRVLAGLQGTAMVDDTAEEPGKIMHELRRQTLVVDDATSLPPLYYGTVDATALWICLLHDAWRWGMPDDDVRALLPSLERALEWMRDHGDADGDGLLEYVDRSGHGLANQGWKDSGDSVQWRDGSLADGPIALCEVQAYAYEAAMHGAELLDAFGRDGGDTWRAWATELKRLFHDTFWITDPALTGDLGPYPAIALDAHKRPVDTVTSNIGHLLGTGLLDAEQSALIARRLADPAMSSGYGLRTMATDSGGYWPLSYHGGAVWTHDTAIAVLGLARDGHAAEAAELISGLLRAAEGFAYRVPELHSGDGLDQVASPVPYPAACRPQAWSAASAVAVLQAVLGMEPAEDGAVTVRPLDVAGAVRVDGVMRGSQRLRVDSSGAVTAS
ncbi:glycogen debranching N-terminal domain-containing protein [Microcella sp.]|uniref:glycogen debranching N-terminal domain-containing protein n=1 Tax=Microcella sp. TaxID=1913979 RepID=UPI00391DCA69